MPPKGSGSAPRGSTRGRGRGRGRGGASSSAPPPADVQSESQSTITSSPAIKSEPDVVVTPEHSRDENNQEHMDLDPNSSPATQPTETPAPTPIRPLSSMQMQSPAIASGSGTRGGAKKESKFKPKNVRRGQEELNALEKKERERRAALAAQQQHTAAAIGVLSYRGRGRGRGDPMGMGRGRGMTKSTSSGVFSVLPAELDKTPGSNGLGQARWSSASGASASAAGTSASKVKIEATSTPRTASSSSGTHTGTGTRLPATAGSHTGTVSQPLYIPDPQYPDEEQDAPRVNIEHINLISSDEDDDLIAPGNKGKGKFVHNPNKGGMKPIRLLRQEHKERIMQVNTDSPRTSSGEKVETDTRARVEPKLRPFVGVWEDIKPTIIKTEPEDEEPAPRVFKPVAPLDDSIEPEEKVVPEPKTKEKKKPKVPQAPWLDPPFVIQTEDDQKEWDRILEDRRILKEELVRKKPDADGDVDMTGETPADKKDGRLYLFQIPPGMPKLYNPKKEPRPEFIVPRHPDDVRSERDAKAKTSRARRINGATSGPSAAPHIKEEEVVIDAKKDEPPKKKGKEPLATMPGYVGKLVIRQSGRAELDWGGSRMLVKRGIQRSFYQMGVLVDSKGCFDGAGNNTGEGTATSLGQIMGNFVVTPDWQSMVADMEREERRIEREEEREFEREERLKERELQKKIEEEKQLEKDKLLAESIRQREIGKGKGREVVMSDV